MSDADRRARIWPGPKYMQREDAVSVRLSEIQLEHAQADGETKLYDSGVHVFRWTPSSL